MTYEALTQIIEQTGKVKLRDLSKVIEREYSYAHEDEDSTEYLLHIDDLVKTACSKSCFEGDSNDFHNLSVLFAQEDEFDYACRFLEIGLARYPYSMDLLADYLNYGMQCGKDAQCADFFEKLKQVRRNWNWRAYQFSIDYLKKRLELDPNEDTSQIEALVYEFVEKKPDREESYLEKARFIRDYGDISNSGSTETYLSVLENATSDTCIIGRTPKCDLSLADYYYNQGKDLDKALKTIDRCKRNSVEEQFSVNRNYVYLLSALCRMSLYYISLKDGESPRAEEGSDKEMQILRIYDDYHVAATNKSNPRVRKNKELIEAFVRETGVPYPYGDNIDND